MSKILIEARQIKKAYRMSKTNIIKALQGVNLDIHEGDFTAIIGPSGCGKSTLMHIIGLVDRSDDGQLYIEGEDMSQLSARKTVKLRSKKIGFIFQGFNLLPTLTALENVMIAARYAGASRKKAKEDSIKILTEMGLAERLNHLPKELSGGQQQRVAIARALINEPTIILADEPTGELDSRTSLEIIEMLKRQNRENQQTFLIVTHNLDVAKACKKIVRMKDGLIEIN